MCVVVCVGGWVAVGVVGGEVEVKALLGGEAICSRPSVWLPCRDILFTTHRQTD